MSISSNDRNNKNTNRKNSDHYSSEYNPKAIERDLLLIKQLKHGKKQLTRQLAQEIYYKIKDEEIQFASYIGEEFVVSLFENMTDDQVQKINKAVRKKKQKKRNRKQLIKIHRRIAIVTSVLVLVFSVLCINWSLLMDLRTNYQTKKLQAKIISEKEAANAATDSKPDVLAAVDEGTESQESAEQVSVTAEALAVTSGEYEIMSKFTQLHEENADFAGWLRIPGTKIDYPVMSREGDNNYYLDKNFEQKPDKNGLLILDYRNDTTSDQQNLIIYGHNMRTGVMFGTLKEYKDKAFCDEHMIIKLDTLYEECEYRVVAAMLADVAYEDEDVFRYYDAIDISTEENFNAFKENIMENALYTTEETIMYGDTCLILSTCDNYKEDGRFVVIAKKK